MRDADFENGQKVRDGDCYCAFQGGPERAEG